MIAPRVLLSIAQESPTYLRMRRYAGTKAMTHESLLDVTGCEAPDVQAAVETYRQKGTT